MLTSIPSGKGDLSIRSIIHVLAGENASNDSEDGFKLPLYDRPPSQDFIGVQIVLHYGPRDTGLCCVQHWQDTSIDIPTLRRQIHQCGSTHGSACQQTSTDLGRSFRVIDVAKKCIVYPSSANRLRFAALSYVWSTLEKEVQQELTRHNIDALTQPGALHSQSIPRMLWDAMTLCSDLGERFIWIDRLCIVQNDLQDLRTQTAMMDKIYQTSVFTIVAAIDENDARGLPGVTGRPRDSFVWNRTRDFDIEYHSTQDNIYDAIDLSRWSTRAWTFQERVLSRRCIYISNYQSYFVCAETAHQEGLGTVAHYAGGSSSLSGRTRGPDIPPLHTVHSLADYIEYVEHYTNRHLSHGSDILNAFRGITNVLEVRLDSQFCFGLPMKHLFPALLWAPIKQCSRRCEVSEIPSWSWAAWEGPTNYSEHQARIMSVDYDSVGTLVRFHVVDSSARLSRIPAIEQWFCEDVDVGRLSPSDSLPNERSTKAAFWPLDANEEWRVCPHNPWTSLLHRWLEPVQVEAALRHPGALVFNTTVATLSVRSCKGIWPAGPGAFSPAEDSEVGVISDHSGNIVGHLELIRPGGYARFEDSKLHRIIVLGAGVLNKRTRRELLAAFLQDKLPPVVGREYMFTLPTVLRKLWDTWDFDETGRPNFWILHVMLVEEDPAHRYMHRRVATGFIDTHQWRHCNPSWETIVLA